MHEVVGYVVALLLISLVDGIVERGAGRTDRYYRQAEEQEKHGDDDDISDGFTESVEPASLNAFKRLLHVFLFPLDICKIVERKTAVVN